MKYSCNFDLFRYVLPASSQRDQHLLQPHPVQEPLRPPANRTAGGRPASPACPAAPATAVWVWMDIYLPSTYVQSNQYQLSVLELPCPNLNTRFSGKQAQNARFHSLKTSFLGLFFAKTGSINSGTGVALDHSVFAHFRSQCFLRIMSILFLSS